MVVTTYREGGRGNELVECEARELAKLLPQLLTATSRPMVMATTREDGFGSALAMGAWKGKEGYCLVDH